MSYYESNYYTNPGPYYGVTDADEPIPGWGMSPVAAGGARVGVGAVPGGSQYLGPRASEQARYLGTAGGLGSVPWWGWVGLLGVAGAALGVARNRGMLRGLP